MDENYVYKKEVDWSLFNYGFAIPFEHQVIFTRSLNRFLERGESKDVYLYLNGKSYRVKLNNNRIDAKFGKHADIVQIRYTENSDLAKKLKSIFQRSFSYIYQCKCMQKPGSKKHIVLPDEYKEYLVIYTTEYDDTYVLETILSEDMEVLKESIQGKQEWQVEAELDAKATIVTSKRLVKVRKLNRLIGENLKLLYGYRCQICGKLIGDEYGTHIAEAHHIDYFVKSLNNDAENQMIVCPNHHRIIHDLNPVFDRKRLLYVFSNGMETKLVLNKHLKASSKQIVNV